MSKAGCQRSCPWHWQAGCCQCWTVAAELAAMALAVGAAAQCWAAAQLGGLPADLSAPASAAAAAVAGGDDCHVEQQGAWLRKVSLGLGERCCLQSSAAGGAHVRPAPTGAQGSAAAGCWGTRQALQAAGASWDAHLKPGLGHSPSLHLMPAVTEGLNSQGLAWKPDGHSAAAAWGWGLHHWNPDEWGGWSGCGAVPWQSPGPCADASPAAEPPSAAAAVSLGALSPACAGLATSLAVTAWVPTMQLVPFLQAAAPQMLAAQDHAAVG